MKKKIIAIIQARSGSKGIKNKNIYKINNHPLIAYTIFAARRCNLIDKIVVSTDSKKYASISKKYGAEVPFLRPKKLSGDKVFSVTSLKHALISSERFFKKKYDYIIELPCVAPLRDSDDIKDAIKIANKYPEADSVISVVGTGEKHPTRLKKIINNQIFDITKEFPERGQNSRRQDLKPESFIRNGAIYLIKRNTLIKKNSRSGKLSYALRMREDKSINIDTYNDLMEAEKKIVQGHCKNNPALLLKKNKQKIIKNFFNNASKTLITANIEMFPDIKKSLKKKINFIYAPDCNRSDVEKLAKKYKFKNWICNPCPNYKIDEKIFKFFDGLEKIVTPSTGVSHIDVNNAKNNGIKVISLKDTRFVNSIKASSEFAFTLMLSTIRLVPNAVKYPLKNIWRNEQLEKSLRSYEFDGKKLCIIGYGRIGKNIAKFSKSLGFKIFTYDPYKKVTTKYIKQLNSLNKLIDIADILVVAVHLNDKTFKMLHFDNLKRLKKGSFFINISRGEIVDERALIHFLKNRKIAAAGVDVITNEQSIDISKNLLIKYAKNNSNLFITPHIAGLTHDSERKAFNFAIDKILKKMK